MAGDLSRPTGTWQLYLACICPDQSERLHTDQLKNVRLTNQDRANSDPSCAETGPLGTRAGAPLQEQPPLSAPDALWVSCGPAGCSLPQLLAFPTPQTGPVYCRF